MEERRHFLLNYLGQSGYCRLTLPRQQAQKEKKNSIFHYFGHANIEGCRQQVHTYLSRDLKTLNKQKKCNYTTTYLKIKIYTNHIWNLVLEREGRSQKL